MIYEILRKAGIRAGLIGTIETRIGEKSIPSENTTPEPVVLQKLFSEMMREGCTHVAVSYTHLDVYKRQVLHSIFRF